MYLFELRIPVAGLTKLHSVRWSESGCDVRACLGPGRFWTPVLDPLPASGLIKTEPPPGFARQHLELLV